MPAPSWAPSLAGWLPWVLLYRDRTIFTFYAIVFLPFLVMALTCWLGQALGPKGTTRARVDLGPAAVGGYVLLVVADTAWLWPLLVGDTLPYAAWLRRLWFRGWI